MTVPAEVSDLLDEFAVSLGAAGGLVGLYVHGSLAMGDFRIGISDLDLVAVVERPVDEGELVPLHRRLVEAHRLGSGCTVRTSRSRPSVTCRGRIRLGRTRPSTGVGSARSPGPNCSGAVWCWPDRRSRRCCRR
ncbi:MAG: nucleotidyltransferase domain-containing protein [Nocardioidaceae bacterium]